MGLFNIEFLKDMDINIAATGNSYKACCREMLTDNILLSTCGCMKLNLST